MRLCCEAQLAQSMNQAPSCADPQISGRPHVGCPAWPAEPPSSPPVSPSKWGFGGELHLDAVMEKVHGDTETL